MQVKVAALWLIKMCTFSKEITTEGAHSLQIMKMQFGELYFKEATVIYGFHPLGARTSVKSSWKD